MSYDNGWMLFGPVVLSLLGSFFSFSLSLSYYFQPRVGGFNWAGGVGAFLFGGGVLPVSFISYFSLSVDFI